MGEREIGPVFSFEKEIKELEKEIKNLKIKFNKKLKKVKDLVVQIGEKVLNEYYENLLWDINQLKTLLGIKGE